MNAGQIVGGMAVIGIGVLTGLAITADDEPQTITTPTSVFTFDPTNIPTSTTTLPTTSSTVGTGTTDTTGTSDSTGSTTETSTVTSGSVATTETGGSVPGSSSSTTSETTAPPSGIEVLPPEEHGTVVVRVINGGGETGAAAFVSGVLKAEAFAPIEPTDAAQPVEATTVYFAAGAEREAATVNAVIGAAPERVIAGTDGDPNWAQFGPFLDVLVVLGPS